MTPRIVLVRHGRSAHVQTGWVDRAGIDAWNVAYDLAGIQPDDRPPPELRALVAGAGRVVSSDMPRALASAALLVGEGGHFDVSPLLRELSMWMPRWRRLRLPMGGWSLAIALGSYVQFRRGLWPDPAGRERSRDAARWMADLARDHGTVVAVTHGAFRASLTAALEMQGWRGPTRRRYHHWSAWEVVRAPG